MRHAGHRPPTSFVGTVGQVAHATRLGVGTCASFLGVGLCCWKLADVFGLGRHYLSVQVQHFLSTSPAEDDMAIPLQNTTANIRGTRNKVFPAETFQYTRFKRNSQSSEQPHKVGLPDGYHIGKANLAAIGNPNHELPEHH